MTTVPLSVSRLLAVTMILQHGIAGRLHFLLSTLALCYKLTECQLGMSLPSTIQWYKRTTYGNLRQEWA